MSYSGDLLLLLRLWIGARRSYFRKSLGGVILERSKTAPGYAMESQSPVFWWNEMKEPIVPIIFPPSATNASILAALYLQLPRYEFHHPKMSAKY